MLEVRLGRFKYSLVTGLYYVVSVVALGICHVYCPVKVFGIYLPRHSDGSVRSKYRFEYSSPSTYAINVFPKNIA